MKDVIKKLDTREQCRSKISVWFGSNDNYTHGLKEVLANSSDEINNNFDNGIITIDVDDNLEVISVEDTGRGIPIEMKTDGVENRVLLFETLFAGTNYDNNESGKVTTGTNGVGTCVLNHTSKIFKVESFRDKHYILEYENGGNFKEFKENKNKDKKHGTKITFKLDDEVYTNVVYNIEEIKEICKHYAIVNNNIKYILNYKNDTFEYYYTSIEDYFNKTVEDKHHLEVLNTVYTENNETNTVKLVLSKTTNVTTQMTFLNGTHLPEQGSIYEGIVNGVRLYINKYLHENKIYSTKEKSITAKDVENSINFICAIESTNVEYANQTKLSTRKKLYKDLSQKHVTTYLELMKLQQPMDLDKLAQQIIINKRANDTAEKTIKNIKKKLTEKITITTKVEGYVDCRQRYGAELFIAEGNSALGSIMLARNSDFQACFPLRGKLMNTLKVEDKDVLKSKIIENLFKVLGCGIELNNSKIKGTFDKSQLKFDKILIATDADVDGAHITCLILTAFYRLAPQLLKDEHIYIVNTPLFEIRDNKTDEMYYAQTDEEKDDIIQKLENYTVMRVKGLGELSAQAMKITGMNPKTRNITLVKYDDAEKVSKAFDIWMGDAAVERKEEIEKRLHEYIN